MDDYQHPTGKVPEHVILLCLGETKREYADVLAATHPRRWPSAIERWTVNAGFRIWPHDVVFIMDDLELEGYRWPTYGSDLARHNRPIITSQAYEQYPESVEYPFRAICAELGLTGLDRYFFNSVPYVLAYALAIGVKRMTIFGADYHHPNQPGREADLPNASWWLGFCRGRGMTFELASDTTLMDARNAGRPLYGYRFDPRIAMDREPNNGKQRPALSPQSEAFIRDADALPRDRENLAQRNRWPDLMAPGIATPKAQDKGA